MADRPPWVLPDKFENPSLIAQETRDLGDEPEKEWSFSLLIERLAALEPRGIDHSYEPLTTWEEVSSAATMMIELDNAGYAPLLGYSITLGYEVFDAALRSVTGRLQLPEPDEPFRGRHASTVAGSNSQTGELVIRNTWGERWGDAGYGYIGEEYFERHVRDAILHRPTWIGHSPAMDARIRELAWKKGMPKATDLAVWLEAWGSSPNSTKGKSIEINGVTHSLAGKMLFTFAGLPFDIVEIRHGEDLKGRVHVAHDRQRSRSTGWELWVPKPSRRQGYGSALVEVAQDLCLRAGTNTLDLVLHEADATPIGYGRAKAFATALGYGWRDTLGRRPMTHGMAVKILG